MSDEFGKKHFSVPYLTIVWPGCKLQHAESYRRYRGTILALFLFLIFQRFLSGPAFNKTDGSGAVGAFDLLFFYLNAFFTGDSSDHKELDDKQTIFASTCCGLCALRELRDGSPASANTYIINHWAPAASTFQTHGSCFQYSPDLRNCNSDYRQ